MNIDTYVSYEHERKESNLQPADLESAALPIELRSFTLTRNPQQCTKQENNASAKHYFLRDSLCLVCFRSFLSYLLSSRRSVPRVSLGVR